MTAITPLQLGYFLEPGRVLTKISDCDSTRIAELFVRGAIEYRLR